MFEADPLRSVIYASRAAQHLNDDAVYALYDEALRLNALERITGVLVYDGERFLQLIEGYPPAIADLLERLERDPRHVEFRVLDDIQVSERGCPGWQMRLVRVARAHLSSRRSIADALPEGMTDAARARLLEVAEQLA